MKTSEVETLTQVGDTLNNTCRALYNELLNIQYVAEPSLQLHSCIHFIPVSALAVCILIFDALQEHIGSKESWLKLSSWSHFTDSCSSLRSFLLLTGFCFRFAFCFASSIVQKIHALASVACTAVLLISLSNMLQLKPLIEKFLKRNPAIWEYMSTYKGMLRTCGQDSRCIPLPVLTPCL